jgi:hypothetical protein
LWHTPEEAGVFETVKAVAGRGVGILVRGPASAVFRSVSAERVAALRIVATRLQESEQSPLIAINKDRDGANEALRRRPPGH